MCSEGGEREYVRWGRGGGVCGEGGEGGCAVRVGRVCVL